MNEERELIKKNNRIKKICLLYIIPFSILFLFVYYSLFLLILQNVKLNKEVLLFLFVVPLIYSCFFSYSLCLFFSNFYKLYY